MGSRFGEVCHAASNESPFLVAVCSRGRNLSACVAGQPVPRGYVQNERLGVALVGLAGRGEWFVNTIPRIGENVVALCDVNERCAATSV